VGRKGTQRERSKGTFSHSLWISETTKKRLKNGTLGGKTRWSSAGQNEDKWEIRNGWERGQTEVVLRRGTRGEERTKFGIKGGRSNEGNRFLKMTFKKEQERKTKESVGQTKGGRRVAKQGGGGDTRYPKLGHSVIVDGRGGGKMKVA